MPSATAFDGLLATTIRGILSTRYQKQMGQLGQLVKQHKDPGPAELERLADAYLRKGRKQTGNSWLTSRQLLNRQRREIPLGDHADRVRQESNNWLGSLAKARKPHRSKHKEAS